MKTGDIGSPPTPPPSISISSSFISHPVEFRGVEVVACCPCFVTFASFPVLSTMAESSRGTKNSSGSGIGSEEDCTQPISARIVDRLCCVCRSIYLLSRGGVGWARRRRCICSLYYVFLPPQFAKKPTTQKYCLYRDLLNPTCVGEGFFWHR